MSQFNRSDTLTEYSRQVAASAFAFHQVSESSFHRPTRPFNRYSNSIQEPDNVQATPLRLREFMSGGDHLIFSGSHTAARAQTPDVRVFLARFRTCTRSGAHSTHVHCRVWPS
ncbi:hypothetical protein EVAR_67655_1 [Eumeta japonica]|uniref:Uncharacterized protein n=1 Tax=Eumeta variegata TaxID=151549 RepID=A0A4C1Z636_EUMVA|nr:hypothetical protein EVAR_67655_1 [Eumeta japonica]